MINGIEIMPGACVDDEREIAAMRKQTHDGLIDTLGARRRSRVKWMEWRGAGAAREALHQMYVDDQRGFVPAALKQFDDFFTANGDRAVLIIAMCEATP